MELHEITSIELDRTLPFEQCIRLKIGEHTEELLPVKQTNATYMFGVIYKKWIEATERNKNESYEQKN